MGEEDWCCPRCGAANRPQDTSCQTVTGLDVPGLEARPLSWFLETPEKLGRKSGGGMGKGGVGSQGQHVCSSQSQWQGIRWPQEGRIRRRCLRGSTRTRQRQVLEDPGGPWPQRLSPPVLSLPG
ncbi:unnamed protein product [Discosporangium mesarthrocarpum]